MKKIIFALCAAAATLVACNKAEVSTPLANGDARVVKFETTNLYSFDTKVAIDANTHVGIYATSPATGGANADYAVVSLPTTEPVANGTLSGSAIQWGVTQVGTDTPSKFFAMYPYENTSERNSFDAEHPITYTIDDDGDEAYALDFLVDVVEKAPGNDVEHPEAVAFNLEHPFALLRVVITNTSDDAIKKVEISGVKKEGTLAFNDATITATGAEAVSLRNMPREAGEEGNTTYSFYSVIIPQTASPVIKITTWTDATSTYTLAADQEFTAGNKYTATIEYNHTHDVRTSVLGTTIGFTVGGWTANDLNNGENVTNNSDYSSSTENWPILRGSGFTNASWTQGIRMNCIGENSFRAVITMTGDEGLIKIYKENGTWYGKNASTSESGGWTKWTTTTVDGDNNIPITSTSTERKVTVIYYAKSNSDPHEVWIHAGDVTR